MVQNLEAFKNPNLRIFKQHGFEPENMSGADVQGNCIFCGSKKFFINTTSKAWNCKICGREGGFKLFLQEIAEHFQQYFVDDIAEHLSENRGITVETLQAHHIGYNPNNKSYLLPIPDMNGAEMWDVKIYKDKKLSISTGCFGAVYRWETLISNSLKDVYLCEGEWDAIALCEIFSRIGEKNNIVVAVPGATTFKSDWVVLFKDKNVRVLYDNDDAGRSGSEKVYTLLKNVSASLSFITWPELYKQGYDVRDLYVEQKNNALRTNALLSKLLKPNLPGQLETKVNTTNEQNKIDYEGPGVDVETVYSKYKEWLQLSNTDMIDVIFGTMVGNRWDGDPLWLFLIAPSGGVKTELLISLDDVPNINTASTLTTHALISGANFAGGADPSLIPQLDKKVWCIKDFTAILNKNEQQREEIFGILRDAYDGKIQQIFGNGVFRKYTSHFGIIAGVTPAIEIYTEGQTALGERFINFKIPLEETFAANAIIARRAIRNSGSEVNMRGELREIAKLALTFDFGSPPEVDANHEDIIIQLAQWSAVMRASIIRDRFSKEVMFKPFQEMPTRLSKQYYKMAQAIAAFRRLPKVNEDIIRIIRGIAISTVPSRLEIVVRNMVLNGAEKSHPLKDIINMVRLPNMTVQRLLENLSMTGVLYRNTKLISPEFGLSDGVLNIMKQTQLYG